VRARARVE